MVMIRKIITYPNPFLAKRSDEVKVVGDDTRTLVEQDANNFRREFEKLLVSCGYEIRK